MLVISDLTYTINSSPILCSLNATFERGVLNAVYGVNGIGKTTLFNCIYGFLNFDGEVLLDGKAISKDDICYFMSENYFYPNLLGDEYLSIFENKKKTALFDINKLAELLGVPTSENIDTFSTGMKKKLAFLAIIKLNRDVFLLDEPFNGVDEGSMEIMKNIIRFLIANSKIVILTSHLQNHLFEIADMYLIMEKTNNYQISKDGFIEYLEKFNSIIFDRIQATLL